MQTQVSGQERPADRNLLLGAREAIRNASLHGHARNILVKLCFEPARVTLEVVDDGGGFDPAEVREGHYGILGMQERVKQMGGTLELASSPGHGSRVAVSVPARD